MKTDYSWRFTPYNTNVEAVFICVANSPEEAKQNSLRLIQAMKDAELEYNDTLIRINSLERLTDKLGWSEDIDPMIDQLSQIVRRFPMLESKPMFSVFTQSNLEQIIQTKNPKEKQH